MIQIITERNMNLSEIFITSDFDSPKCLDDFDVNIIDLSYEYIWRNRNNTSATINKQSDLSNFGNMMRGSTSKVVIIFPQNATFCYHLYNSKDYNNTIRLRDMLPTLEESILKFLMLPNKNVLDYQNTITRIGDNELNSDFCFCNIPDGYVMKTKSQKSGFVTTINKDNAFFTTINIMLSADVILDFLTEIGLITQRSELPSWINDVSFFDDDEKSAIINKSQEKINKLYSEIEVAQEKLDNNLYYKSILCVNGSELVRIVFDMLEKMLKCDLHDFVDEKREDFVIKLETITFVGEIKGVTTGVKNEHISQLDVHYQTYKDTLEENELVENVKALLIINYERTKPVDSRQPIHENQIKLANRNGSLIISTHVLLKMFDSLVCGEIDTPAIVELLNSKTGLLQYPS